MADIPTIAHGQQGNAHQRVAVAYVTRNRHVDAPPGQHRATSPRVRFRGIRPRVSIGPLVGPNAAASHGTGGSRSRLRRIVPVARRKSVGPRHGSLARFDSLPDDFSK